MSSVILSGHSSTIYVITNFKHSYDVDVDGL